MIDPITLSILGAAGGSLISGLPNILPSKFEREQRKRMQDLQRKEEMGLLGLTDQERRVLEGSLEDRSNQAANFAQQERERLLAASGAATSGAALLGAQMADEQLRQQNTQIAQAIEEEDLAKKQQQTDELRALEAAQSQYAANRIQSITNIAEAGLEAGLGTAGQQKIIQGATTPSENSVSAISSLYGIPENEARGLIEISAKNPEVLQLYQMLNKTGGKTGAA